MIILELLKWIAAGFFLVATGMMFSQKMASKSIIPWTLFFVGNSVWLVDSYLTQNIPWLVLSAIFVLLDGGLVIVRLRNKNGN